VRQELTRTAAPSTTSTSTTSASTASTASSSGSNSATPTATAATIPTAATSAPSTASQAGPPTAESVFGANPWETDPTGTGPDGTYDFNQYYFATPQTASIVASMVGGKVVACDGMGTSASSPFVQNQPNEMVELPNGTMLNPGLVASFYTHGYPESFVDQMVANEVANVSKGN
jgi:hypothetical protein